MEGVLLSSFGGGTRPCTACPRMELSDLNNRTHYLQASSIKKNRQQKDTLLAHMISFHSASPIHFLLTLHHKRYRVTLLTLPNSLVRAQNICQAHIISYLTFIPPSIPTDPTLWYKQQLLVQKRYGRIRSNVSS